MNIKQLESRFKDIDLREKKINSFFNPFNSNGPKHYCIKDLHKDFEYDTQLYGLGKFYQLPSGSQLLASEMQGVSQVMFKSPLKPSKTSPTKTQKGSPSHEFKVEDHYKTNSKFEYRGTFSSTTVKPRITSLTSDTNLRNSNEWTASQVNERITNKSALEKMRFQQTEISPITLKKKAQKERIQVDPKDWVSENEYKSKPPKKFILQENDEKSSPIEAKQEKVENRSNWFDIRYVNSPLYTAKEKGVVSITLVCKDPKNIKIKTKQNEQFFLSEIEWFHMWKKKILRIQEHFSVFSEYFLFLGDKFQGSERVIEEQIDFYFSSITPEHVKRTSISPVMPINLKKIQHKSPGRSKSSIKLPLINEKKAEVVKDEYQNPLTQRLVKYKQSFNQFNPVTFPANLTIFEMHDKMETKYKKYRKVQSPPAVEPIGLGVQGKSIRN